MPNSGTVKPWLVLAVATMVAVGSNVEKTAVAAEGGQGFYLLGSKGSLAGILPPAGTYLTNDAYFYSGDVSRNLQLPTAGGELAAGLDADVFVNIVSLLHVPSFSALGGNVAVGAVVPVVGQRVRANGSFSLDGIQLSGRETDRDAAIGDPLLAAIFGWNRGNFHATLNGLLNIPVGSNKQGALANAGFNRWGFDATLAMTYFDPAAGYELTIAPGMTFNGRNLDSGYKTGTEFHVEFAAMKHFSQQFALGVSGYHYQQITDDSGQARFPLRGRATAIGPALNFNFKVGPVPISGKAKFLHEFDVQNRLKGNAGLLQFAIPLAAFAK